MAHAIFIDQLRRRSLSIEVYSAGIENFSDQPPIAETSRTCLHYQTAVPKQKPTWVADLPLDSIDCFLVMEQRHADGLRDQFGVPAERISLLGAFDPKRRGTEIIDPFFSYSEDVYRTCYELIRDCVVAFLDRAE